MDLLRTIRVLTDPGRIRILRLLLNEELNVAELQEILGVGQSTLSMQLSQLKQADLVELRRQGTKSIYSASLPPDAESLVLQIIASAESEIPEISADDSAMAMVLSRRQDQLRSYFDELAGKFGRNYVPGRSWKALSETLIHLLPPLVIADLGAGEGTLALMLSKGARKVIAVDNSEKMVEYSSSIAEKNGINNIEFRYGDMEKLPITDSEADIALFHQSLHHAIHPQRAIKEAFRILKPGGRILILDLLKHDIEAARELYADVWLGFSRVELNEMLVSAGFTDVEISVVDRSAEAPHFESLMGVGRR